ncbi:MAG: energy transducer TonB [Terriglobales bacterium]
MPDQRPEPTDELFHLDQPSFLQEFSHRIKEVFRPEKTPDLVLESKPIPVKSIWSPPKPLSSRLYSLGGHVVVIGIILLPFWYAVHTQPQKQLTVETIYIPTTNAPIKIPKMIRMSGGGTPKIAVPKLVQTPDPHPMTFTPTLLAADVNQKLPTFGALGPVAGPPGAGGGVHGGSGGMGAGSAGGNCTGPDCVEAGEVAATGPVAIYQPDPEYTDAARKARYQGTCIVRVVIGANGRVSNPTVVQPLGLGLDQKAVEAVLKWRFAPARDKNGKPIAVVANIELNFHLY